MMIGKGMSKYWLHYLSDLHLFINLFSRGSSSLFEVQRFWVGKDLHKDGGTYQDTSQQYITGEEVENAAASTLASKNANPSDSRDIIAPRLHAPDPCTRCNKVFEVRRNTSTSCRMHVDSNGKPGKVIHLHF